MNDDPADVALEHNADAFVRAPVGTIMSSRAWTAHSAIFIVADEGDDTGVTANGGWDSPAGCGDSAILPAGDPGINAAWPGGLHGGGLVPAIVIDPSGPRHFVSTAAYNHYSMLRTVKDAWHLPELGFTSDHAQVRVMKRVPHPLIPGPGRRTRRAGAPARLHGRADPRVPPVGAALRILAPGGQRTNATR